MAERDLSTLKGDIFGGLTAAIVALPLALAFGVASGVGPLAGLYGAIAVGFFAAVFGGTPAQVSGPTGPMAVVMAVIVAEHADHLADAFTIVFMGGLFQIAFGLLRVGRYVSYTPYSVVSGFMSGIGVIIILIQVLPFFGLPTVPGGAVGAIGALPTIPARINVDAMLLAGMSLAIMIYWPVRWQRLVPAPLVALVVGTLLALTALKGAPVIGNVPTGLPPLFVPSLHLNDLAKFLQPALILGLLGSIDSLLTSLVADSITRTRHNSDRELIGQGIGNMMAGLIGGLPGAGATMRTVVNVRAGGRTPISGALHALVLLALALGLAPLAERVPHAALSGILLKVGWDIIDWGYLRRIRRAPRDKILVMLTTLTLTVFVDLITAVAVGLILAGFVTARWMEKQQLDGITAVALPGPDDGLSEDEKEALTDANGEIIVVRLRGSFSYASARELTRRVAALLPGHRAVVYDFSDAAHIDTSAALAVEELVECARSDGHTCFVSGLSGEAAATLDALGALEAVPAANVLPIRLDAIVAAKMQLTLK
ncbi:MAG: SulP family inorganic anion transporter [Proteobacteria bacterium]|nr:SulP family inorganic anion transporter [Pseudomonadota bacterium]